VTDFDLTIDHAVDADVGAGAAYAIGTVP